MEPDILIESYSPFGSQSAVLENDGRVLYLYLAGQDTEAYPVCSCWVRNVGPAPKSLEVEAIREGQAPMLPQAYCLHPVGLAAPDPDTLRIVWLPAGNGVALYECDELLAVIPPWSGYKGFHGYARDCHGESQLCWGLKGANAIYQRLEQTDRYWKAWDDKDNSPWSYVHDHLLPQVVEHIGPESNYYAIDGGTWPPKALMRIPVGTYTVLLTLGLSNLFQPGLAEATEDGIDEAGIELGAILPATVSEDEIKAFGSFISGQSRLPWTHNTCLGHGHTIPCDAMPACSGDKSAVLLAVNESLYPELRLTTFDGRPIKVLWMLAISEDERARVMEAGGAAIMEALDEAGFRQSFSD